MRSRGSVGFRWTTPSSAGPPKKYLNPWPLPTFLSFFLPLSIFIFFHNSSKSSCLTIRQRSTVHLRRPSPTPLNNNSSVLSLGQSRTSNLRFGAIGGPTTPMTAQNSRRPIQHTISLGFQPETPTSERVSKEIRHINARYS